MSGVFFDVFCFMWQAGLRNERSSSCAALHRNCFLQPFLSKHAMLGTKPASRAWSCGSLVHAAAQVVDMAAAPTSAVIESKKEILDEQLQLDKLSAGEIEKMLKENVFLNFRCGCQWHSPCLQHASGDRASHFRP